jgi:hypothetical protein
VKERHHSVSREAKTASAAVEEFAKANGQILLPLVELVHGFGSPQSGCIEQHQDGAVSQVPSTFDQPDNFLLAQDNWQFLGRSHERQIVGIHIAPAKRLSI